MEHSSYYFKHTQHTLSFIASFLFLQLSSHDIKTQHIVSFITPFLFLPHLSHNTHYHSFSTSLDFNLALKNNWKQVGKSIIFSLFLSLLNLTIDRDFFNISTVWYSMDTYCTDKNFATFVIWHTAHLIQCALSCCEKQDYKQVHLHFDYLNKLLRFHDWLTSF